MSLHGFATVVTEGLDRTTVSAAGDPDFHTCESLTAVIRALTLTDRILVLDLTAVTFMGTSALHLFLALRHPSIADGWTLELSGLPVIFFAVLQRGRWPPGPVWLCPPCRTDDLGGGVAGPGRCRRRR